MQGCEGEETLRPQIEWLIAPNVVFVCVLPTLNFILGQLAHLTRSTPSWNCSFLSKILPLGGVQRLCSTELHKGGF